MNIKKTLEKLDKMIADGKTLEAFDKYFDNNVLTHDNHQQKTTSKQEKRDLLVTFFEEFSKIKKIKLHDSKVLDPVSFSKFTFVFEKPNGEIHEWHETIKRTWKNELVVEEYYSNEAFDKLVKQESKKDSNSTKKQSKNKEKNSNKTNKLKTEKVSTKGKIAPVKIETKKVSEKKPKVKVEKTNINKNLQKEIIKKAKTDLKSTKKKTITEKSIVKPVASKPAVVKKDNSQTVATKASTKIAEIKPKKVDDLKVIEGIGPKIALILKANNIGDLNELSKASETSLNNILEAAGSTYKSHNPSTWPTQAKLAAAGKIEELNELKKRIVSGVLQK